MTSSSGAIGVFDLSGDPWCLPCWAEVGGVSDQPVMPGTPAASKRCKRCQRMIKATSPREEACEVDVVLDGEGAWPDLAGCGKFHHEQRPKRLSFARLPRGMTSGRSSVAIRIDREDGTVLVVETTMRLFLSVADAFRAVEAHRGTPPQRFQG